MGSDEVNARLSAVAALGHGLAAYGRGLEAGASSARRDLNRIGAEFDLALVACLRRVDRAARRVDDARAALAACRQNCEGLQRALAEAQVALDLAQAELERARRAKARFDTAAQELLSSLAAIGSAAAQAVPAGRAYVREHAEILEGYLQRERAR